ncbi:hypothetical protein ANTPLA_LOCUS9151 [Anthophora plagiata]
MEHRRERCFLELALFPGIAKRNDPYGVRQWFRRLEVKVDEFNVLEIVDNTVSFVFFFETLVRTVLSKLSD